jgi:hypothetical protein
MIILAVVLVIALIAVGVMGGIPGIGGGAKARSGTAFWTTADIAITSHAITAADDVILNIRNNLQDTVTITSVSLGGTVVNSSSIPLPAGQTEIVRGSLAADDPCLSAGSKYSLAVSITYTDSVTGTSRTLTSPGNNLEGTCAS